jgi:hypothetical protein
MRSVNPAALRHGADAKRIVLVIFQIAECGAVILGLSFFLCDALKEGSL